MNILVVEDDEADCNLIKINLDSEGYTCTVCNDGADGADHIEAETYDLVLLDIMLPRLTGMNFWNILSLLGCL